MKLCFEYLFLSFSLKFVARFVCFSNCASLHLATDCMVARRCWFQKEGEDRFRGKRSYFFLSRI